MRAKKQRKRAQNGRLCRGYSQKGKITLIAAKPRTETVKGTVKEIYTSDLGVYVKLTDVDDNEVSYIAGNDITVNKNGTTSATLSEVRMGDSVSMTLEYGFITKIIATSKNVKHKRIY
ncbi:MAG: hypothetical protein L6V93_06455 [Clostridiales bacterium]|nr:MAG: hypothetical protein L6V93_06455 [Clostridiales bacterium]